jgi:hypothetical protein
VGWLVGRSVCLSVCLSVGRSVGWLVRLYQINIDAFRVLITEFYNLCLNFSMKCIFSYSWTYLFICSLFNYGF